LIARIVPYKSATSNKVGKNIKLSNLYLRFQILTTNLLLKFFPKVVSKITFISQFWSPVLLPDMEDLLTLRAQVLLELKLAKQGHGAKAAQQGLAHFIVKLTSPESVFSEFSDSVFSEVTP
jgi:hypothetical protein